MLCWWKPDVLRPGIVKDARVYGHMDDGCTSPPRPLFLRAFLTCPFLLFCVCYRFVPSLRFSVRADCGGCNVLAGTTDGPRRLIRYGRKFWFLSAAQVSAFTFFDFFSC